MSSKFAWENFFRKDDEKDVFTLLKSVPIFEDLSRRDFRAVERILHRRKYHAGEYIFRQGDPGLGMYIVVSGTVSIVLEDRSKEIARLAVSDFFGEKALFSEEMRSASAVAYEDTELFGFFQPDLFALMETHPRIGVNMVMKLARIISERLNRTARENSDLLEQLAELQRSRP